MKIPDETIDEAASILTEHLDSFGDERGKGLSFVGGDKWWRVRGKELEGEWIEVLCVFLFRHIYLTQDCRCRGIICEGPSLPQQLLPHKLALLAVTAGFPTYTYMVMDVLKTRKLINLIE